MRIVGRSGVILGAGLIVAACIVLAWPLRANGVSGTAFLPRYSQYFGFSTFKQIPVHPTNDDLRRAGVRLPVDVVWHRRHIAEVLSGGGLAFAIVGGFATIFAARRREPERSDEGSPD